MSFERVVRTLGLAIAVCFLPSSLLLPSSQATAGHGFPPFGAWAYGSGVTTYVGHRHHFHHRHAARVSYRVGSYWPTPSVYYRHHRPFAHYRSFHVSYPRYYASYIVPSYSTYYPTCAFYPVVSYPTYVVPSYVPVQPVYYPVPTCSTQTLPSSTITSKINYSRATQTAQPPAAHLASVPLKDSSLPDSTLNAADAILRAGGYREAATAYAQLWVRYGASDALFARRFVAQIASGDLEQAVVISASARAAGFSLDRATLPSQTLAALGLDASLVSNRSEALAEQAYKHPDDIDALAALGHWLHFAGDDQRSQLFIARAVQLSGEASEKTDTRSSKVEFVSLD